MSKWREPSEAVHLVEHPLQRAHVARGAAQPELAHRLAELRIPHALAEVDEVRAGLECGVVLADTNDIQPGDNLEVFEVEERERTL